MTKLARKKCLPCEGDVKPLDGEAISALSNDLGNDWRVINEHHLEKLYLFKNFKDALEFTNQVGALAESEGHHPDISLTWGKVRLVIWTHAVNGLTDNDFILAAKCDELKHS